MERPRLELAAALEPFMVTRKRFCFSDGEAIRQERRDGRGGSTTERLDEAGARQRETLRAGCIRPESFGFRLGRGTTTPVAEILDLVPDARRQNDSG
jgi:hypothetical protein